MHNKKDQTQNLHKQWEVHITKNQQQQNQHQHIFVAIDHEIISTAILLPSPDSRWVVVSYKRKYVYEA